MEFVVGDRVVHPHHGPGLITGAERREFFDGKKLYYELSIPAQGLSVFLTGRAMRKLGVRAAMSRATLPRVLSKLRSEPRLLPKDYKQRQEEVWERLRTGRVMQMAEVVRDLTWHEKLEHLTKKDSEFLAQGTQRLAAEMALVSGGDVADMEATIKDTLDAAISARVQRDRGGHPFDHVVRPARGWRQGD
jgi:CarD family transcriptional regulator